MLRGLLKFTSAPHFFRQGGSDSRNRAEFVRHGLASPSEAIHAHREGYLAILDDNDVTTTVADRNVHETANCQLNRDVVMSVFLMQPHQLALTVLMCWLASTITFEGDFDTNPN